MFLKKKNKNEFTKSFNFFEPREVTWNYLLSALKRSGWLTDIDAIRNNASVVLIKADGIAIHAEVVGFIENESLELAIKRKEIGSQQFLFQLVSNKKKSCVLNVKTKIDFTSDNVDQSSARLKIKNNFHILATEMDKLIRDEMELAGFKSWF